MGKTLKKKIVVGRLLTLFLIGMLMLAFKIQPLGADPTITILSPENKTYTVDAGIPLTFMVDGFAPWIGYSLDGQANVTINENTILPTLPDGWHHVIVYANDTLGNMGASDTIHFTVDTTAPTGSIRIEAKNWMDYYEHNGVLYVTSTSGVYLFLTADDAVSGVDQVRYSNDGVWDIETWENASWFKDWTLTSGVGQKTVYYQIRDNAGLISTYSGTCVLTTTNPLINADYTKPLASAGLNRPVNEDTLIILDGSESYDDVGITSYTWTFTDVTSKTLIGEKPTYTFNTPGLYVITLNVTDALGNWATDTVIITVLDITKPAANAGQDQTVKEGATVNFDAAASTDNVGIVSYEWDFGDGTNGTGVTTSHLYSTSNIYTVKLTVKDAAGNTATHSITVAAEAPQDETSSIRLIGAVTVVTTIAAATAAIFLWKRRK